MTRTAAGPIWEICTPASGISLLLAAAATLVASPAHAQQEDEQLWLQVNTSVPLAGAAQLTLEQIARFSDRQEGLYQTEFGALLSYRIVRGVEVGAGYRKVGAHNRNTAANEDRFRQQIVATFGRFASRFRVDERFDPRGDEVGVRIRPLLRYNHPIATGGAALFVSHESFWLANDTSWGQRRGYERMRNIAGLVVRPSAATSLDIGYLNQFRFGRDGARDQMDHALTLQLTIKLHSAEPTTTHD